MLFEDHGYDVIFRKGKVFLRHIAMTQMKHIGVWVKNLYVLEVPDAWKVFRNKVKVRDLVVEREHELPLNMQPQKMPQKFMEQPQLEKQRGDWVEASTQAETSSRGNFELGGKRGHMKPYLQVRSGEMWSNSPKSA